MSITKEAREMVTDHVIVRWLERVEGYDFDDIRKSLGNGKKNVTDKQILRHLADNFGLFRGHVIYRIATKQVKAAIKLGATKVNRGDWTLVINQGVVVTLVPRGNAIVKAHRAKLRRQRAV